MSAKSLVVPLIVLVVSALPLAATAGLIEQSSTNKLAAGDFDADGRSEVAYILPGGDIRWVNPFGGAPTGRIAGAAAVNITAGNVKNTAGDEVVWIMNDSGTGRIRTYNVPTATLVRYGLAQDNAVAATSPITSGDWNNDGKYGVVVLADSGPNVYASQDENDGNFSYVFDYGYLSALTVGEFSAAQAGREFIGIGGLSPPASNGTVAVCFNGTSYVNLGGPGGGLLVRSILTGNVKGDGASEIGMIRDNADHHLWQWDGSTWTNTLGGGAVAGAGSIESGLGGLDQWFVIGGDNRIYRHTQNAGAGTWSLLNYLGTPVGGNQNWSDFILADFDGDGLDEIFAIRLDGQEFYFDGQLGASFIPMSAVIPEPSTWALALLGTVGLAGWRRGRRPIPGTS
jgi:hypothetical protein